MLGVCVFMCDCCLVDNTFLLAVAFQRAFVFYSTVAIMLCSVVVVVGFVVQDLFVVGGYYLFNVWHTAVTDFYRVPVDNFVEFVVFWEAFSNELDELFANVCLCIFVERGVEPGYFSRPSS